MIILTDDEMQDPYSAILSGIQSLLDAADSHSLAMSDQETNLFPKLRWLIQDIDPAARTIRRMGIMTATKNVLHPELQPEFDPTIVAEVMAIHLNLSNNPQTMTTPDTGEQ